MLLFLAWSGSPALASSCPSGFDTHWLDLALYVTSLNVRAGFAGGVRLYRLRHSTALTARLGNPGQE